MSSDALLFSTVLLRGLCGAAVPEKGPVLQCSSCGGQEAVLQSFTSLVKSVCVLCIHGGALSQTSLVKLSCSASTLPQWPFL